MLVPKIQEVSYEVFEAEEVINICIETGNQSVARNISLSLLTVDGTATSTYVFISIVKVFDHILCRW